MDEELDHSDLALIHPYLRQLRHHEVVKVGVSLGLDSGKLSDVRSDEIHHTMIERWLGKQDYVEKISGKPTWRKLVKALRNNGYSGGASNIEGRFGTVATESTTSNDGLQKDLNETSCLTVRSTVNNLKADFNSIVKSTKMMLINQDASGDLNFEDFREDFIFDLPESTRDHTQLYIEKKSKEIYDSSNYNELFVILNACWDYLNPYLLQHIILIYGGEQLRSDMNQYLKNLRMFMERTSINDFLEALPDDHKRHSTSPPMKLKKVITKHNLSGDATLQIIENIRIEFCALMRLTRFSLFIVEFSRGSVIIVWYVTDKVAEMLADLKQHGGQDFEIIEDSHELLAGLSLVSSEDEDEEVKKKPNTHYEFLECLEEDEKEEESIPCDASIMLYPTKVKDQLAIFFPPSLSGDDIVQKSFGRWLVGEPLYKLNETWQKLSEALETGKIAATGLKSSTGRYNPSSTGPGPVTNGAVSVYTTEENADRVGFEVIEVVQHDIQYKEVSADGQYRHRGARKIISKKLFWNRGKPSFVSARKSYKLVVWSENKDKWHLNVAKSPREPQKEQSAMVGYWCVECKIEHLTDLWHSMRDKIVTGTLGPVTMECPGREKGRGKRQTNPVVFVRTAEQNVEDVSAALTSTGLTMSLSYVSTLRQKGPVKVPSVEGDS